MAFCKITFVASIGLTVSLLLHATALGEDKTKSSKKEQPTAKAEKSKPAALVSALQAGFALIDYGREQNDPVALLTAARLIGTTPVSEMKFEAGEGNDKKGSKAVPFDKGVGLRKQAQDLIGDAQEMAKDLPKSDRAAIEALAKSTLLLLKEQSRSVAGRPAYHRAFIRPGGSSNPYVLRNVALQGNYTWFNVQSLNGVDLDIKVVGALTGAVYAVDNYPNSHASVRFNHFPVAVVNIVIENCSGGIGEFILTSN